MANLSIEPNDRITFRLYYEDEHVIVVGKASGVVSTPGKGHDRTTLLNGLFAKYGAKLQNLGRERDFGLLHRLDKGTSGLLIAALTRRAYDGLRASFEAREIAKFYWAVVRDVPNKPKGVINRPIAEYKGESADDPRTKKLARISSAGKPSITAYRVLSTAKAASLLECRAVTGRLHQVRVHLYSIGCPVLGDDLYGPSALRHASSRLALHAYRVRFAHPISGETIDVRTPWPPDLRSLLKRLGLQRPDVEPARHAEAPAAEDEPRFMDRSRPPTRPQPDSSAENPRPWG